MQRPIVPPKPYVSDVHVVPVTAEGQPAPGAPPAVEAAYEHPEKVGHPDGVPHDVVGRTALTAVLVSGVGVIAYFAFGALVAIPLALITLFLMLRGLPRKARQERTNDAVQEIEGPHAYTVDPEGHVKDVRDVRRES